MSSARSDETEAVVRASASTCDRKYADSLDRPAYPSTMACEE